MKDILLYTVIVVIPAAFCANECWWTGCQNNDWAVKGCEQYNRSQTEVKECAGGLLYLCCEKNSEPVVSSTTSKPIDGCWWTGCQKNDWAIKGCNQYDRVESDKKDCLDGSEYLCCEQTSTSTSTTPSPSSPDQKDCWWTGCQLNNWAVTGCMQYNLSQVKSRDCDNGHEYFCCPKKEPPLDNELECSWSGCQPKSWPNRGCPSDTKQAGIQPCNEEDGDMFQCCGKKKTITDTDIDILTGDTFENFVKYLLLKGKNFTIDPDNLPCLSVDIEKQALFTVKNEGIYICDLCPYFPQKRFINVFLGNDPIEVKYNTIFPECYGYCFDKKECVAYSYDHLEHICYIFENTIGTFQTGSQWTTVFMTQPVGILDNWMYSRHTSITGNILQSTNENNFKICLQKCQDNINCNYVSYSINNMNCTHLSSQENIYYIDLQYAYISAFKISSMPVGNVASSRFVEDGEDLFVSNTKSSLVNNKECSSIRNLTHSEFYSKSCLTSASLGCNTETGCKLCYYPENTNEYQNLVICPDSEWTTLSETKNSIKLELKTCLTVQTCLGVGYNSITGSFAQISFSNIVYNDFTTKFILKYPVNNFEDQMLMSKYDILPNYDIIRISNEANSFQELPGKTFKECLKIFDSNKNYIRMSFFNNICKISSKETKFNVRNEKSIAVFKRNPLTSAIINYGRTPGYSIPHDKAKMKHDSCLDNNCEEICAIKCNQDYGNWCTHFSTQHVSDKVTCYFFDFLSDNVAQNVNLQPINNEQVFTKLSSLDFSLNSLNNLNPFQSSDIYNCFQPDSENQQTQTSLTTYDTENKENTKLLRRKRGFFDFIKKAVKAVGNFVADTVKSVVKTVGDTAKGVVNTVKNVVKGDFKKAKESFVNIPIVKDVKNVVDLGKAVVTGDWDKAKERGIDLLQSQTLDIATSFIPVGGKVIGTGLKTLGKTLKTQSSKVKNTFKNKIDKVNTDNRKIKDNKSKDPEKKDSDKDRDKCKRRTKRSTPVTPNRSNPNSCKDDDNKKCPNPSIDNVIEETMTGCQSTKKNAECQFECMPGYDEPDKSVKCEGKNPSWKPPPTCSRVSCGIDNYPLIPVRTPQISNFGNIQFGRFITVYVVLYNKLRKLPVWSIALHQSNLFKSKDYTALKKGKRAKGFTKFQCPELTNYQAGPTDYSNSGWDQGHLTPANVALWSHKAKLNSNLFINIAPQDPYSNQGPWKTLETKIECFSKNTRSLVATGICPGSIGKTASNLDVPRCYWKMICYKDENSKEQVVGFISDNTHLTNDDEKHDRKLQILTPVAQSEIKKFLPNSIDARMRSPWIYSATKINQGRPVQVGLDPTVWFPVNPFDCENVDKLSDFEKNRWDEMFKKARKKKSPKKKKPSNKPKKKTKTKRSAQIKIGCSESEYENMKSILGFDDEDSDEDESDSSDDERGGSSLVSVQNCNKRIIGYYTSWGDKKITGKIIRKLTHVIYAFLEMSADGTVDVGSADRKNSVDINEEVTKARERLEDLMLIASNHPHVKVTFAVGGWENSQYFSSVASNPEMRVKFIASIIKMIQKYGFDGVDIDWEYPVTGGANEGIPKDKENYVILMKEIRTALDNLAAEANRGENFILSFAGAAGQWTLDPGFDLPGLLKYADFVNIMTYDYFGAWASKWGAYTGPPSPLYFGMPPRFSGKTNTDWTVKYYTCKTKLPHKINMGVPFYGRYWKNVGEPVDGKDGMWRTAQSVNGKFEGGYVPWNKIESEYSANQGFQQNFHEKSKTPYAWNPNTKTFLGYENDKSLQFKVDYAVKKNVGGLMIWSVELDDDDLSLLEVVYKASLCDKTDPNEINHKCSPIDEKRWWTSEDGDDMAGLCGRSAPLYKGYYPVCDPDDPGYSCCGSAGYCGSGEKYCDCPTCKNYGDDPKKILESPIKPSIPVTWYLLNAEDGKRGRCGRKIPKINNVYPTCNPDDENSYCCSNGGYCGNTDQHCKCNGCINFKNDKNYKFGPKKWWSLEDGEDKAGKCGPKVPKVDGYEAECEPNTKFSCCSENGFCGSGPDYCDCPKCKKFT